MKDLKVKALFLYENKRHKLREIGEWVENNPEWVYDRSLGVLRTEDREWMIQVESLGGSDSIPPHRIAGRTYDVVVLKGLANLSVEGRLLLRGRLRGVGEGKSLTTLKSLVRPHEETMLASILCWE